MTRDNAIAKLAHLRRRTYTLELEPGDGTTTDSKLGGTPYLPPATAWPACESCGARLLLQVQLNTAQLPESLRKTYGQGVIQAFECACGSGQLRMVEVSGDSEIDAAATEQQARVIRGWRSVDDYPGEDERLGVELTDEERASLANGEPVPRRGDKLSGWPAWTDGVGYPACSDCGKTMRMVLQLQRDDGTRYLTQCPTHKGILAWA